MSSIFNFHHFRPFAMVMKSDERLESLFFAKHKQGKLDPLQRKGSFGMGVSPL